MWILIVKDCYLNGEGKLVFSGEIDYEKVPAKANMKYKKLKGICKVAIEKGMCAGCLKLELESFEGVTECKYVPSREKTM